MIVAVLLLALAPPGIQDAGAASHVTHLARFATSEALVALTFDTDTVRGQEGQVLDVLAAYGVKATFAVTGAWAAGSTDLLRRMVDEGHALISHSWSHPWFSRISSAARADELRRTEDFVRAQVGVELRPYFRPPYGDYNDAVLADLAANGYNVNVWWTIDSDGWRGLSADQVTERVVGQMVPGAIVLMHSNVRADVLALPAVVEQLRARGYRFATIPDLARGLPAPEPDLRFFPETGYTVGHGFLRYWQRFGGLPIFGYPLTDERQENGVTVQYFERARFEYHPGQAPARYDVLLGQIGREIAARGRGGPAFQPVSDDGRADCTYFAETQHRACSGFRDFWNAHGGVPIFGYPISEELDEAGITVQYFERARFEYHPADPGAGVAEPFVALSRVGVELLTPGGAAQAGDDGHHLLRTGRP